MIISECLPVFVLTKFRGVTCADLKVDTFFSEIIDFHLKQLSYAFLVDSRGRIQIHPLLPRPEKYLDEPIFLNMESVEISSEISSIKQTILRWATSKRNLEFVHAYLQNDLLCVECDVKLYPLFIIRYSLTVITSVQL